MRKEVYSEAEFVDAVKEEKIKLFRRMTVFMLGAVVWCGVVFGGFYPLMIGSGDNEWSGYTGK